MKIGIIGCGWLGKPLAKHLRLTHQVSCFSREHTPNEFWDNELFIIAISTKDNYLSSIKNFLSHINPKASIILMSSTSVYKEFDEEVNEETKISQTSLQTEAEELVLQNRSHVLILRLGGLMGEDRIAGKWKSISTFTDSPVNYIHQEDILHIVAKLIHQEIKTGIYNLVAPLHPLRSEVHKKNSEDFGFELGKFEGLSHRIVNGDKIFQTLDYKFKHPNPLEFWK